jgi:hypothetical protein
MRACAAEISALPSAEPGTADCTGPCADGDGAVLQAVTSRSPRASSECLSAAGVADIWVKLQSRAGADRRDKRCDRHRIAGMVDRVSAGTVDRAVDD